MRALLLLPFLFLTPSGLSAQSGATGAAAASRRSSTEFIELPGVRRLSGRLIARPRQVRDLLYGGATIEQATARVAAARRAVAEREVLRYVPQTDEYVLRVVAGGEENAARALLATGAFEYVEPDWLLAPVGSVQSSSKQQPPHGQATLRPEPAASNCPDDPLFALQWHHATMDSCAGWTLLTGDPGISIGICDTGIRTTHEDLLLHRLEGYNAVDQLWESEGGNINPVYPHGTRTTGTAAANGNNGIGVSGMGWNLNHRMIRVSNQGDGGAFLADLQHGARTSIEAGDRVANVSYHGASLSSNLPTAAYIKSIGGLLLWSAGNTSSNLSSPPRDDDDLLVIGGTGPGDVIYNLSSYGNFVDLFAPGVGILTTDSSSDSSYVSPSGTSYACPLTSGLCALIWSQRPELSPADVQNILKQSCDDIGAVGVDSTFGYGRINMNHALTLSGRKAPQADFTGQPTSGKLPLTVQFRDQTVGVPTAWLWDFGDGTTSTLPNPPHTYTTAGFYPVSLAVANSLGADMVVVVDFVLADVIPPVPAFDATPTAGLAPVDVTFTDQSGGGTATSWLWDFGDGATSTLQHPTHTYTSSGFYTVSLTVGNAYGSASLALTDLIAVDLIPPVADFAGTPLVAASPFVVDFTDLSIAGGVPTSWLWNFGDSTASSLQNPSHTYTAAGTYFVSLMVSNAYGSDTLFKSGYVTVLPGPEIVADFVGTPTTGTAPFQVTFTDLTSGNPVAWQWDFGDGGTSTLQHPTHVYAVPDQYNVNLEVTTAGGKNSSLELQDYITVQ